MTRDIYDVSKPDLATPLGELMEALAAEGVALAQFESPAGWALIFTGPRGHDLLTVMNQALIGPPQKETL